MADYHVTPLPDGTNLRASWQVKKNGRRLSKHRKKSAATREARRKANMEDRVVVHRKDGTIMG